MSNSECLIFEQKQKLLHICHKMMFYIYFAKKKKSQISTTRLHLKTVKMSTFNTKKNPNKTHLHSMLKITSIIKVTKTQ